MKPLTLLLAAMAAVVQAAAQATFSGTIDLASSGVEAPVAGTPYEFWIYNWDQGGSTGNAGTFVLGAGGTYSFSVSGLNESGTYRLYFKSDFVPAVGKKLQVTVPNPSASVAVPSWTPVLGDLDLDNEIGVGDFAVLSAVYNTWDGHPLWDNWSDMNRDGFVDAMDYSILSSNFGMVGDDNEF